MVAKQQRRRKTSFTKEIRRIIRDRRLPKIYFNISLVILFLTTILWSLIGAAIQSFNADQVTNAFLFQDHATLAGAVFPSQHTFLLKIPLLALIGAFGGEPAAFVVATVFLSLLTVGGLAFILYRIEKRPLVLGTILLALAAVLLYIPVQSYPGSLLPANFAMVTTRNIEYVLFIGALISVLRAKRIRSGFIVAGAVALALLFASDRLFVPLVLGTATISGLLFVVLRRRDLIIIAVRLLGTAVAAYILAALSLIILARIGVHFDTGGTVGPYGLVRGPKEFIIAVVYAVAGVFTNLGANPAFATLTVKDFPIGLLRGVFSPAGPGYIATVTIAIAAIIAAVRSFRFLPKLPKGRRKPVRDWRDLLAPVLAATSLTALAVYIISNHYYPADSRYLAIVLFTGFIALASVNRKKRFKTQKLVMYGALFAVASVFGIVFQAQNLQAQHRALGEIERRNAVVASALRSHPVQTLLGNYWRVLPIKLGSPTLRVTPLQSCTDPRQVLSSKAWQLDLTKTRFAYILRLDGALADFPRCTLKQITDSYGRPDSSVVIAGTREDPKELLLFYDDGIHFLKDPAKNNTPTDTVTPISVDAMPFTTCPGKTVMQFVAHEDDDILFMNPDLTHSIKAGDCIRSVFFTAGDAGGDSLYWLGRQHGAEAAYNTMLGTPGNPWTERVVALDNSHFITVANPRGNHTISLVFLHLPDGNPDGSGFARQNFESLRKLYSRAIPAVHNIDDRQTYTAGDLTSGLAHLMEVYKPAEVRAQSTFAGSTIRDHSDHNAVGEFTRTAFETYKTSLPEASLTFYMGYPIHALAPNVEGSDYDQKVATFLTFGQYDGATCKTLADCTNNTVYGYYLQRQYTLSY